MRRLSLLAIALAFATLCWASPKAHAVILVNGNQCNLATCQVSFFDLFENEVLIETIQLDDKLFSNFDLELNGQQNFPNDPSSTLALTLHDNPGSLDGPSFDINWSALGSDNIQVGQSEQILLTFDVMVTDPGLALHDLELSMPTIPTCTLSDATSCRLVDALILEPSIAGVFNVSAVGTPASALLSTTFSPLTMASFTIEHTNECLTGNQFCGFNPADATYRFSQVELDVPEPGTLAIFGVGLAGLGWLRWRRTQAA